MARNTLITLFLFFPLFASADFKSYDWNDDMSDTKTVERYTTSYKDRFGFRCDITPKNKEFMITFNSDDSIATPNSAVQVKIRIDKGKVHDLKGRTYNNSYKSGVIKIIPSELLHEIKKGSELLLNIYSYRQLKVQKKFSLAGSSKALNETAGTCGVFSEYSKEIMSKIKALENERDKKISKIQKEYAKKIVKVKTGG